MARQGRNVIAQASSSHFVSSLFLSDILCCRSDELYAYLSQHRQDLCILEGGEEDEAERGEEDFVLLDEEEQEEEEGSPHEGQAGEDWEVSHLLNVRIEQTTHISQICK